MTDTVFQGITFPSLDHARWALVFDDLRIPWQFRIQAFPLEGGAQFQPDFWLPRQRYWFHLDDQRYQQWRAFAIAADDRDCPVRQDYPHVRDCDLHGRHPGPPLTQDRWRCALALYSVGGIPQPQAQPRLGPTAAGLHIPGAANYQWTICPACGYVAASPDDRAGRLACGHSGVARADGDPRVLRAYRLARQANTAEKPGVCPHCTSAITDGDLITAGRSVGQRTWYHAGCLLHDRRRRYAHPTVTPVACGDAA